MCEWCSSSSCKRGDEGKSAVGEELGRTGFKLLRFLNHDPGDFDLNSFPSFSGSLTCGTGMGLDIIGDWEVLNIFGGKGGNGGTGGG